MTDQTQRALDVAGCRIGSCQRHGECMYTPCRSVTPMPNPPEIAGLSDEAEIAGRLSEAQRGGRG